MQLRITVVLAALVSWQATARAEHARIDLRVFRLDPATGNTVEQATASADKEPPLGGLNPRPLLKVKAGEPLALQFFLTNTYPHGDIKGAVVRYFVVREQKAGQKTLPSLGDGVVTDGQFTLTFKPEGRVGARVAFRIPNAGVYLLRVQTENTQSDHEHFSAIDLDAQ